MPCLAPCAWRWESFLGHILSCGVVSVLAKLALGHCCFPPPSDLQTGNWAAVCREWSRLRPSSSEKPPPSSVVLTGSQGAGCDSPPGVCRSNITETTCLRLCGWYGRGPFKPGPQFTGGNNSEPVTCSQKSRLRLCGWYGPFKPGPQFTKGTTVNR